MEATKEIVEASLSQVFDEPLIFECLHSTENDEEMVSTTTHEVKLPDDVNGTHEYFNLSALSFDEYCRLPTYVQEEILNLRNVNSFQPISKEEFRHKQQTWWNNLSVELYDVDGKISSSHQ